MSSNEAALELRIALLKWIQSFSPTTGSLVDLRDGHTLFEILIDIDAEYFATCTLPVTSRQETATNWIPRWQNLKHIQSIVAAYVRDVCGVLDAHAEHAASVRDADLKALAMSDPVAADGSVITTLLTGILRAAMYSPVSNQRMGRIVLNLGPDAAQAIAAAMAAMEEGDEGLDGPSSLPQDHSPVKSLPSRDDADPFAVPEMTLEQEERMINAHRAIRQLESTNARLAIELDSLRKDKHDLQEALESFKIELDSSDPNKIEGALVQELRRKANLDRDYIADLETDLSNTKADLQSQNRQLEKSKTDNTDKQQLRDEVQLLRSERDELSQKVRVVDNLRKKIQLLQEQERQGATMREDLRYAREQLQHMDALRERCERLQMSNTENLHIMANTEQEIFDQKTSRKKLVHELKLSMQRFEAAKDRQIRDHETIAELEKKLQQAQAEPSTPASDTNGGLESELRAVETTSPQLDSRGSSRDLSAEIESRIESRLQSVNARNKLLENEYLTILQDKLGLETLVQEYEGSQTAATEQSTSFLEQRKRLHLAHQEIGKLRAAMYSLTADLASAKEKLLTAHTPLIGHSRRGSKNDEASDADSTATDTIQDLKAEYQTLTKSYTDLTRHAEVIEAQLAQHKSLVRHALLTHRALLLDPEATRKTDEYGLMSEQLKALVSRPDDHELLIDLASAVADKIESARVAASAEMQKTQEHEATIAELKSRLQEAEKNASAAVEGPKRSAEMELLQRENKLVASAWYDLTTRLQSADVTINMRRAEPKSYLMKQRAAVGLRAPFGMG